MNDDAHFAGTVVTALSDKAPKADPTFTGVATFVDTKGLTKAMVGLDKVDNTADKDKIISDTVKTALGLKEAIIVAASPLVKGYQVGGPNDGKMLLSLDTSGIYTVNSLTANGNATVQGVLTADNVVAGALSCSRNFTAIDGQNSIAMTSTKTTVGGPITFVGPITASSLDVAGTVSGGGFNAFFDSYSAASLGKKENLLLVSQPLLKTAVGEKHSSR